MTQITKLKLVPIANRTQEIDMLGHTDAIATLAVKDLDKPARFYEEKLGLSRAGVEEDDAIMFESGDTTSMCTGQASPARTKPRP